MAETGMAGNVSFAIVSAFHSGAFSRNALRTSGGSVAKVIFSSVPE
jgi:hypothetical protein